MDAKHVPKTHRAQHFAAGREAPNGEVFVLSPRAHGKSTCMGIGIGLAVIALLACSKKEEQQAAENQHAAGGQSSAASPPMAPSKPSGRAAAADFISKCALPEEEEGWTLQVLSVAGVLPKGMGFRVLSRGERTAVLTGLADKSPAFQTVASTLLDYCLLRSSDEFQPAFSLARSRAYRTVQVEVSKNRVACDVRPGRRRARENIALPSGGGESGRDKSVLTDPAVQRLKACLRRARAEPIVDPRADPEWWRDLGVPADDAAAAATLLASIGTFPGPNPVALNLAFDRATPAGVVRGVLRAAAEAGYDRCILLTTSTIGSMHGAISVRAIHGPCKSVTAPGSNSNPAEAEAGILGQVGGPTVLVERTTLTVVPPDTSGMSPITELPSVPVRMADARAAMLRAARPSSPDAWFDGFTFWNYVQEFLATCRADSEDEAQMPDLRRFSETLQLVKMRTSEVAPSSADNTGLITFLVDDNVPYCDFVALLDFARFRHFDLVHEGVLDPFLEASSWTDDIRGELLYPMWALDRLDAAARAQVDGRGLPSGVDFGAATAGSR